MTDSATLLTILAMGIAVYATRLAGFWILQGRVISGRYKAAVEAVPAAILTAVIAPTVFLSGTAEVLAGAITLTAAMCRLPLLVVIATGMISVVLLRFAF